MQDARGYTKGNLTLILHLSYLHCSWGDMYTREKVASDIFYNEHMSPIIGKNEIM